MRAHRRLAAEPLEDRRMLATVTVTNALNVTNGDTSSIAALMGSDGGDGISLREAIEAANNTTNSPAATPDVIEFDIAGAGPHVIDVSSGDGTLPSIIDAVTIDGYSQTGASPNTADIGSAINATLQIVLDGNNLASPGLTIATAGSGSTIQGLNIRDFNDGGILIASSNSNVVAGNFLGTNETGTAADGNSTGVSVTGNGSDNTIGGTANADRNLISGNSGSGVALQNSATMNTVLGNFIGLQADGTSTLGNSGSGVIMNAPASGNTVGGTTTSARNVIGGNTSGVRLFGVTNATIVGNYIGVDRTGASDAGNTTDGVLIEGASSDNTVGGTTAGARNIISGNDRHGVHILADDTTTNTVSGNYIGTDFTGTSGLPNTLDGVHIDGADNNTIGGTTTGAGNVISANGRHGIQILSDIVEFEDAAGNMVLGNFIGTDVNGTAALGNDDDGVLITQASSNTIGGTTASARNVISGNGDEGVEIFGSSAMMNLVQGNYIGTAVDGTTALGNTADGVEIVDGFDNVIGGTAAGAGNVIAFNGTEGVEVAGTPATGNAIQRNSIFNNTQIGIDISANATEGDGVTANDNGDPDEAANRLQNFPVFVGSATLLGNSIAFRYRVPTNAANATYPLTIDFYIADSANQEGQTYLASDTYTAAEAEQTKIVIVPAPPVLTNNAFVATATDAAGNSSEFSDPVSIELPTILGSEPTLILPNEFININQVNRYQYIAHSTGKTVVRIDFLHLLGDLDLEVRDENGFLLAEGNTSSADQNFEEVILPMVGQETYFINVIAVDFNDDFGQFYALEVENFAAPDPTGVHLDPNSDTGMMNNDGVTADTMPTLFIQTDVLNFVDTNNDGIYSDPDFVGPPVNPRDAIHALTAAEAQAIVDGTPQADDEDGGIAVEVTLVNTTTSQIFTYFADPVIADFPDVYQLTVPEALPDGTYLISARTKVFDGQSDTDGSPEQAMARSNDSPPLWITIDTALDANMVTVDMLAASDSGSFFDDNVTNKMQPAFQGVAPANTKIRLYANGELVGQTVTGSDTSDVGIGGVGGQGGADNDGLGLWEITSEPLADDFYVITVEVEDAAGNVATVDPELEIVIDTLAPNTPYLNVVDAYGGFVLNNMPTVTMTTTDPNVDLSQLLFDDNYRFLLYDRFENTPEFLLYDSADDPFVEPQNTFNDVFTALELIETMLPNQFFNLVGTNDAVIEVDGVGKLADGVHNLKLEVEDRAGNISDDFILEITVDTSPQLGTWAAGEVAFGPSSASFAKGTAGSYGLLGTAQLIGTDLDYVFAGKFLAQYVEQNPDEVQLEGAFEPLGFNYDTLAAYGRIYEGDSYVYRWLIDLNGNGYIDPNFEIFEEPSGQGFIGVPVAGNFDGNLENGDEVGLFTGTQWYLDTDHDFNVTDETPINANYAGFPIAGDFDGDGDEDLATYIATSTGGDLFYVDLNNAGLGSPIFVDGVADFSFTIGSSFEAGFGFSGTRERPVSADFNADGIDDFGLWVPDGISPVPNELSEWYLLLSGDDPSTAAVETTVLDRILDGPLNGYVPFIPALDIYVQHGNNFALPVVGRFAPKGFIFDFDENGGDNGVPTVLERDEVPLPEQVEALVQLEAVTTVEIDPPVVEEVPATPREQPPVAEQTSFASQEVVAPEALVETVVVETVEKTTPKQEEPAVVPAAIETPPSEEEQKTESSSTDSSTDEAPVAPVNTSTTKRVFRRSRSARFSRAASTFSSVPSTTEPATVELPAADPAPVAELKTPAETFVVEVSRELPPEPIPALFKKPVVVASPEVEPAVEKPPATSKESDALEAAFAEVTEVELSQPDSEPEEDLAVEQAKVWQQEQTTSTSRRRFRRSRFAR